MIAFLLTVGLGVIVSAIFGRRTSQERIPVTLDPEALLSARYDRGDIGPVEYYSEMYRIRTETRPGRYQGRDSINP